MRNVYEPSKLASFASLVAVSAMLGVVVAFVLFPVVGGAGMAAQAAAVSFENLPTDLKVPPLPQRSTVLASDGSYLASFYSENRITVSLSQVPDSTRKAVVAIEDSRFYEHNGVDIRGIARAFVRNQEAGQVTQGASTLTQQYVKQVLLEQAVEAGDKAAAQAAVEKNKVRKLREIRYALALEEKLSKDQILERYLNIGYFGAGAYGIGTAAQVYFGKSVSKLTLSESALLAGLLQSPSRYDPFRNNGAEAIARRNIVLARMGQLGFVPEAQAEATAREPLRLHRSAVPNGCATAGTYAHFCDYVRRYLLANPSFGATREARQARLFKGGLIIRTTMERRKQQLATAAVKKSFKKGSRYVSGLAVVEPGTGRVKALALSRPFTADQFPYLDASRLQTGSTAKAFVLAAALQKGLPLTYPINSPHDYTSKVLFNYDHGRRVHYSVSNDARGMHGVYDMRSGIAASVNTYYVQLEEQVGVDNAVRAALALGVPDPVVNSTSGAREFDGFLKSPADFGSFTLGAAGIAPIDMANAYATFAAHGVQCAVTPIERIIDSAGKALDVGGRKCHQALDRGVADAATEALSWVVRPKGHVTNGNTGGRAYFGRPVAGKTGTTQDVKEAWFVGFAPQLSGAAVVFDPKHQVTLPGGDRSNRIAVKAWHDFMQPALEGNRVIDFPPVEDKYVHGDLTSIPEVDGRTVSDATAILEAAGFSVVVSSTRVPAAPIPAGLVGSTSPRGGSSTISGAVITLYLSNGEFSTPSSPPPVPKPKPPPKKCRPGPFPRCR